MAIGVWGALGDTIMHYFRKGSVFGRLQDYKRQYPNSIVKVICCSSNSQTIELFKANPFIDKAVQLPWQQGCMKAINRASAGCRGAGVNSNLGAVWKAPRMHVTDEEAKVIIPIKKAGKYVLIHPFASQPGKQPLRIENYPAIIDAIIDKAGYNVVVVGATYKKSFIEGQPEKVEEFDYERPGLYNLVNKASVRVAVNLARKATGYVGSWSAFYCACINVPLGPIVLCTDRQVATIDRVNKRRFVGLKYHKVITGEGRTAEQVAIKVVRKLG